jgi:hypothetical protein
MSHRADPGYLCKGSKNAGVELHVNSFDSRVKGNNYHGPTALLGTTQIHKTRSIE